MTSQSDHSRNKSTASDEFGSFVSVPATNDPLGAGTTSPVIPSTTTFGAFADDVQQRAKKNESRVLDELRAHQEDPLSWPIGGGSTDLDDIQERSDMVTSLPEADEGFHSGVNMPTISDMLEPEYGPAILRSSEPDANVPSAMSDPGRERGSQVGQSPEGPDVTIAHHDASPFMSDPLGSTSQPSGAPNEYLSAGLSPSLEFKSTTVSREGPKERAEKNEKRILDELRTHDDDPLGWLKSQANYEDTVSSSIREAESTLIDLGTPASEAPPPPSSHSPSPSPPISESTAMSPKPSFPRAISSPIISRSPERARSQSPNARVSISPSASSSLSRSWMSTLGLLGTSRAVPASSSPSAARGTHDIPPDNGSTGLSPTQSSLHSLFARAMPPASPRRHVRFPTEGHTPTHAATLPAGPITSTVTSPFSSHVYVPPSGAPGFAGDHNWNPGGFEFDPQRKTDGKSVRLLGRRELTIPVLDAVLATALRSHLPPLPRIAQSWTLLYSADQHGLSLNTLYERCSPPVIVGGGGLVPGANTGALVAMQDAEGGVFGAWVPEGVHLSHGSYYGGGDSFLWRADMKDGKEDLRVYKWTGRNGYVAYCDTDGFSFGGGEGHYGLYVDANLIEGTTHPCPTFDNECLAHGEKKGRMVAFDAVGLEVWSIGS